jgi:hypothetical protein
MTQPTQHPSPLASPLASLPHANPHPRRPHANPHPRNLPRNLPGNLQEDGVQLETNLFLGGGVFFFVVQVDDHLEKCYLSDGLMFKSGNYSYKICKDCGINNIILGQSHQYYPSYVCDN